MNEKATFHMKVFCITMLIILTFCVIVKLAILFPQTMITLLCFGFLYSAVAFCLSWSQQEKLHRNKK